MPGRDGAPEKADDSGDGRQTSAPGFARRWVQAAWAVGRSAAGRVPHLQTRAVAEHATSAPLWPEALVWPLVGREAELERIAAARTTGDGPGLVIGAAAGVGKSWLGAFAGLIPAGVRADDPLELMRRSVHDLRERAADRPIVLGVDDAQLFHAHGRNGWH